MSTNAITRFWSQLSAGGTLATEFDALVGAAESVPADEIVALGTKHGYEFTKTELHTVLKHAAGAELTEAELETVTGGTMHIFVKTLKVEKNQAVDTGWDLIKAHSQGGGSIAITF